MSLFTPSTNISDMFHEVDHTTGLTSVDFTITVVKDGVIQVGYPVSITELGGGFYRFSFTPNSVGLWAIDIVKTSDDVARYVGSYPVREAFASQASINSLVLETPTLPEIVQGVWGALVSAHSSVPGSFADYINRIKKYATNKVTLTGINYTVYEDDKTTPFEDGVSNGITREPN